MTRTFKFTWYVKKDPKIIRNNAVAVSNTVGDIGVAAKSAVDIFTANFGSLAKNEIIEIQEFDRDGNYIGEPIRPTDGSAIVPLGKRK